MVFVFRGLIICTAAVVSASCTTDVDRRSIDRRLARGLGQKTVQNVSAKVTGHGNVAGNDVACDVNVAGNNNK
jgi:hypothetical protein